jgi:hypothetical protein
MIDFICKTSVSRSVSWVEPQLKTETNEAPAVNLQVLPTEDSAVWPETGEGLCRRFARMEGTRRIDTLKAQAQRLREEVQRIDQEVLKLSGKNGHSRRPVIEKEVAKKKKG